MRIQGVAAGMYTREEDLIHLQRCLYLRTPNLLLVLLPVSQAATAVSVILVLPSCAEYTESCSSVSRGGPIPKILVNIDISDSEITKIGITCIVNFGGMCGTVD